MKALLEQLLLAAVRKLVGTTVPPLTEPFAVVVERTRDAEHGDYASSVAMRLAKRLGRSPREVAQAIVELLPASSLVSKTEIAGNGFINFFLAPQALAREIRRIHELGEAYGRGSSGAGKRVTVGLVSEPVDVAWGSYAAYSESLANVLAAAGYEVEREALAGSPQSPGGSERSARPVSGCSSSNSGNSSSSGSRSSSGSSSSSPVDAPLGAPLSRPAIEGLFRQIFLLRTEGATPRPNENPLYDAQYAHARVASAMKELKARDLPFNRVTALDNLELLDKKPEQSLIAALLRFPEEVESAAANCAPHSIVYYLREVANAFHTYYNAEKWFVADDDLRSARLALVLAAGQVVRNGLALIGVSAPESM